MTALDDDELRRIADHLLAVNGLAGHDGGGEAGVVIWLTGLSGAGKTTVSRLLSRRMTAAGLVHVVLDGDALRALFAAGAGHGLEQRRRLALTYGRLCREIAGRGIHVLCATISMFHAVHDWNRARIDRYVEIYLRVPAEELRRRDPRGLYARAEAGLVNDVVGIHLPAEEPRAADLVIEHRDGRAAEETAALIAAALKRIAGLDLDDGGRSSLSSFSPQSERQ